MQFFPITAAILTVTGYVTAAPLTVEAGPRGEKALGDYENDLHRFNGKNGFGRHGYDNPYFRDLVLDNKYGINKHDKDEWKGSGDDGHDHEKRDLNAWGGRDSFDGGRRGGWDRFRGGRRWGLSGIGGRSTLPLGPGGDRATGFSFNHGPEGYGGLGKENWEGRQELRGYGVEHGLPSAYREGENKDVNDGDDYEDDDRGDGDDEDDKQTFGDPHGKRREGDDDDDDDDTDADEYKGLEE